MIIDAIELYMVEPQNSIWRWSDLKPEQRMGSLFVRIKTSDGIEGVAGITTYGSYMLDKSLGEAVAALRPVLIGKDPLQRERILKVLRSGYVLLPPSALAAIDIALWDIAGKVANLPLYKLLGGYQDSVAAYASTPTFATLEGYLDFVEEMLAAGFTACKFHVWGNPQRDIQLIQGVAKRFEGRMTFMFDAEGTYSRETALKVGRVLDEVGWEWFEMPFPDHDLTGYRWLSDTLDIPVVPGGFWLSDLSQYAEAFKQETWDIARVDATLVGGLTLAQKVAAMAEAFSKRIEVQCFGFTLGQVTNLHLILGINNCHYFEMPVPYGPFDAYMLDILRADEKGRVRTLEKPGLGFDVDWQAVKRDAFGVWS